MFIGLLLLWKGFHNIVNSIFSHLLVFRMRYMALCEVFAVLDKANNNVKKQTFFFFFFLIAVYVVRIMILLYSKHHSG